MLERFTKRLQKTNQKKFKGEKVMKRKVAKLHVKWKDYDNYFNSLIDKIDIIWVNIPKAKYLGEKVKVESDLSNYATKTDLRSETGVHTFKFAEKVDLKSEIDKLDAGKLESDPVDLEKLKWCSR